MAGSGMQALCRLLPRAGALCTRPGPTLVSAVRCQHSPSTWQLPGYVPKTSLSEPPWPQVKLPDPRDEAVHHAEVVERINNLIANGQFGRLFAVIQFASRQWKVTNEDLILSHSNLDAACGDRIRLEKVLLVGSDDFTLIGKPLLGRDLVRIEATVIEKSDSFPKVHMRFWKRHHYQRKRKPSQDAFTTAVLVVQPILTPAMDVLLTPYSAMAVPLQSEKKYRSSAMDIPFVREHPVPVSNC